MSTVIRKLPSGAKLKVNLAPFTEARALMRAVAAEGKGVPFRKDMDVLETAKSVICTAVASKKLESALWKCMERCLYNGQRITEGTFESAEARVDYLEVCLEVAKHNLVPFAKSLLSEYGPAFQKMNDFLKSNEAAPTTPT